jgi:hypothetical protein
MGSGVMIYIPSFINTGSGIQTLAGWNTQTHRYNKPTFIFLKKDIRLQIIRQVHTRAPT